MRNKLFLALAALVLFSSHGIHAQHETGRFDSDRLQEKKEVLIKILQVRKYAYMNSPEMNNSYQHLVEKIRGGSV